MYRFDVGIVAALLMVALNTALFGPVTWPTVLATALIYIPFAMLLNKVLD